MSGAWCPCWAVCGFLGAQPSPCRSLCSQGWLGAWGSPGELEPLPWHSTVTADRFQPSGCISEHAKSLEESWQGHEPARQLWWSPRHTMLNKGHWLLCDAWEVTHGPLPVFPHAASQSPVPWETISLSFNSCIVYYQVSMSTTHPPYSQSLPLHGWDTGTNSPSRWGRQVLERHEQGSWGKI